MSVFITLFIHSNSLFIYSSSSFMLPGAPNTTIAEYLLIFKGSSSPRGGLHISATYPLSLNLFPTSPGTEVF